MSINEELTRDDLYKELDLWPVWRLRSTHADSDASNAEAAEQKKSKQKNFVSPQIKTAGPFDPLPITTWDALRDAVNTCTRCKLHSTRTQGVFGVGDLDADWLIIGEAPGADEDVQGQPFVGQAGRLLDAMLAAIGLKREENVYITNVLKSRPPGNRNPEPDEVAACMPYLLQQIELLQPRIIIALGRFAVQNLLNTKDTIGNLRGRVHQFNSVPVIVTYHPAYLLRTLTDKAKAWEDLCLARQTYLALTSTAI